MGGRSRLRVVVTIIVSMFVLPLMSLTTIATPLGPAAEAPLCDITLDVEPEEIEIFPTYEGSRHLMVLGELTVYKYRPGNIRVHLQAQIDVDWTITPLDNTVQFEHVGTQVVYFPVNIIIPPHTVGPISARVDLLAYFDTVGVDEGDSAVTNITILPRSDEFLVNLPSESMAVNGVFDGMVTVYNLQDQELEFHLCALGAWAMLMPDLDFQNSVVLAPNEAFETRYHGEISPDVQEGTHRVEIALWTPGPDGERIYVTIKEVSIILDWDWDGLTTTLGRFSIPLVIFSILTVACVAYYVRRRRHSYLEETEKEPPPTAERQPLPRMPGHHNP